MGRSKKNAGAGCLALFGLPFFLAGLFVFYIGVSEISNAQKAKDWLQVAVTVETLTIKIHSDSDGTTYSVETRYTYSFEGENYTGHRFSFATGSDNVTDYQEQIDRVRDRKPAYGFMNPDHPEESVLIKEIPVTASFLIPFGLVFMIVGLSLIIGGITLKIEQRAASTLYKIHKQVKPSRIWAFLPLALLTGGTSFAMVFVNVIVLSKILDPIKTLYTTLAVLSVAFGLGLVLAVRSLNECKIFLQIKTLPGTSRPFEVDVDFNKAKASRKPELSNTSAIVDVNYQTQTKSSSLKKVKIATLGMKQNSVYQHTVNFKMEPGEVKINDPLTELDMSRLNEKYINGIKTDKPLDFSYIDVFDMAAHMGAAMAGGPKAPQSVKKVRESLEEFGTGVTTQFVLSIGRKKLKFQLPTEIWEH